MTLTDRLSLRVVASLWVVLAMLAGGGSVWLWTASDAAWDAHLNRAYIAGLALADSLEAGSALPQGLSQVQLRAAPDLPPGWRQTVITLTGGGRPDLARGARLSLRIQSPDLTYPAAEVQSVGGGSQAAAWPGSPAPARFCSEPRLFVQQTPAHGSAWTVRPSGLLLRPRRPTAASWPGRWPGGAGLLLGWVAGVAGRSPPLRPRCAITAPAPPAPARRRRDRAAPDRRGRERLCRPGPRRAGEPGLSPVGVSHDLGTPPPVCACAAR